MSTVPKIDRIIIEDNIKKCYCSIEQIYKPCVQFSPRAQDSHPYQYYCVDCVKKINAGELELQIPIYVRQGANTMLSMMGYNTKSNKSVYEQFKEKHNLL